MATQQEYSYVANALVAFAHKWIATLPPWQQAFIPMDKVPAAAGATAKEAVDVLDAFRANHPPATPPVRPLTSEAPRRKYRRRK